MRKNLFFTAIAVAALVSCKKENNSLPPGGQGQGNNTESKIKEWTGNSGMTTYLYDGSGRCTQYSSSTGSKVTFEFTGNKIVQKQFNNAGVNDFTREYELNASGLISKETRPGDPDFEAVLLYNSDKQVVKKIYHMIGGTQTIDYFYNNGNCDSTRYHMNSSWTTTVKFTYHTDKPNTISYEAMGMPYFGKESKNLNKTEQYFYPDGTSGTVTQRSYEFDAAGRVIKQTGVQGGNINISYLTYY